MTSSWIFVSHQIMLAMISCPRLVYLALLAQCGFSAKVPLHILVSLIICYPSKALISFTRGRCLPAQAKALAVSSMACFLLGFAGYHAISYSGVPVKDSAEVSSLHNAVVLAEDQRVSQSHSYAQCGSIRIYLPGNLISLMTSCCWLNDQL